MSDIADESNKSVNAHSFTAKFMHWGFILVYLYGLTKQLDEVDELEDLELLQAEMIFATVFLILLFARFVYMHFTQPTAMPVETKKSMRVLARTVHLGMYVSLSASAITGLAIGGLYGAGTKAGGAMDALLLIHEIAVNTTYFLIIGHIAAAIYHRRRSDGMWNAMVPFWKEPLDKNNVT